jgi:hypothetical protein
VPHVHVLKSEQGGQGRALVDVGDLARQEQNEDVPESKGPMLYSL